MAEGGEDSATETLPTGRRKFTVHHWLALAAVLLGSGLAFSGLGRHALWDDEAHTALLGRNVATFGKRTAWNGTNLIGYNGGRELNENFQHIYAPPQDVYLAAAGIKLLGDSRFGARALFVVAGVLAIAVAGWWARRFFGTNAGWWLPALLLAMSPAYLLFIRNCRYYAPGLLWAIVLWAAWTAMAERSPGGDREREARRAWCYFGVALVAGAGLWTSQYVYAMTALGVLPLFFLERRFRGKRQVAQVAIIGVLSFACLGWIVSHANPLDQSDTPADDSGLWMFRKVPEMIWWQVRDVGVFEFFAWPMIVPLCLPWVFSRMAGSRDLARRGWILVGLFAGAIMITAIVSPQKIFAAEVADSTAEMRYSLLLLPLGAMISAASLMILWRAHWLAGMTVAGVLLFSNLLHLGAGGGQLRNEDGGSRVRATLFDYLKDVTQPFDSVYDLVVRETEKLPAGTTIRFFPSYMAYPAMFESPHLHYGNQLAAGLPLAGSVGKDLPAYVLSNYLSEFCVLYVNFEAGDDQANSQKVALGDVPEDVPRFLSHFGYDQQFGVQTYWPIGFRPEIPLRWFGAPELTAANRGGLIIYRRAAGGEPAPQG